MENKLSTKKKLPMIVAIAVVMVAVIFSAGCLGDIKLPGVTEKSINIWFYDGDQSISKLSITEQSSVQIPIAPIKDGYQFEGWYLDKDSWKKPFDFSNLDFDSDAGVKVYAHYVKTVTVPTTNPEDESIDQPKESTESPKVAAVDYADGYSVTPCLKHYETFIDEDNNKLYVRYVIANIKGAPLAELSSVAIYNDGGISSSFEITDTESIKNQIKSSFETLKTSSVGHSVGVSVSIPIKIVTIKGGVEVSHKTTETSVEQTENYVSQQHDTIQKLKADLSNYPAGKLYRIVVKGDCDLVQTLVFDLNKMKLDTSNTYIDCITTGNRYIMPESSSLNDNFRLPDYSSEVSVLSNIDVSKILPQASNGEYIIKTFNEFMLIPFDTSKQYQLGADIDINGNKWFDYKDYLSYINKNGYTLEIEGGSADSPYEITNAREFMEIYKKPSAYYILLSDIDLTDCSIPKSCTFSGTLDGANHMITGMSKDSDSLYDISIDQTKYSPNTGFGLFSENNGVIKNLKLKNFGIYTSDFDYVELGDAITSASNRPFVYLGCVVGINSGTISNVEVIDCRIFSQRTWSGSGLIVGANARDGIIKDCTVTRGMIRTDGDVGGIAGWNNGKISSCSVKGDGGTFITFIENSWFIYTGYNGRSIGGAVGYDRPSSSISSTSVSDIHMDLTFKVDACHVGSIAGSNEGVVSASCTASSVTPSMKRVGSNSGEVQ